MLAAAFVGAGVLHLVRPDIYDPAMPPFVPAPRAMILVSGVAEILGGLGLLAPSPDLRRWAGKGLAALLVAVYPANVWMAMEGMGPERLLWARLPLQGVLVAAVLLASGALARLGPPAEPPRRAGPECDGGPNSETGPP